MKAYNHLRRFNDLSEVDEEGNSRKLSKHEKQKLFNDLCLKGPRIVIDCDYESLMRDSEIRSLGQQLSYVVSANKQLEQPMNLIISGVDEKLFQMLDKQGFSNWSV